MYINQFYVTLGLSGVVPLVMGATYVTVATLGNMVGALILDRVGRKPLLLAGLAGCMVAVILETAFIAQFAGTDNQVALSFGVLFSFIFISFYGACIDVVGYVYCGTSFSMNSANVSRNLSNTYQTSRHGLVSSRHFSLHTCLC